MGRHARAPLADEQVSLSYSTASVCDARAVAAEPSLKPTRCFRGAARRAESPGTEGGGPPCSPRAIRSKYLPASFGPRL